MSATKLALTDLLPLPNSSIKIPCLGRYSLAWDIPTANKNRLWHIPVSHLGLYQVMFDRPESRLSPHRQCAVLPERDRDG